MGAVGYTTFDFQYKWSTPLPNNLLYVRRQTRPLILGQDFSICYHAGCSWTDYGTKRFTTRGRLIMEIEEPGTSKYFTLSEKA